MGPESSTHTLLNYDWALQFNEHRTTSRGAVVSRARSDGRRKAGKNMRQFKIKISFKDF